jgi:hypothetical protein
MFEMKRRSVEKESINEHSLSVRAVLYYHRDCRLDDAAAFHLFRCGADYCIPLLTSRPGTNILARLLSTLTVGTKGARGSPKINNWFTEASIR